MLDLSRHIEFLLLTHDRVSVPQLGTFTALHKPSRWSQEEDLFLPPYRTIQFEQNSQEEGTLFLDSIAQTHHLSLQEALIHCTEYTEYIQQELLENGTLDLGSIGMFVREKESEPILFLPCQAGVATPAFYGLDAIHMQPLPTANKQAEQKQPDAPVKLTTVHTDDQHITIRINRRIFNYVASIAASILLFFAFSTPAINTEMTEQQKADTNFFFPSHLMIAPQAQRGPAAVQMEMPAVTQEEVTTEQEAPLTEEARETVEEPVVPETEEPEQVANDEYAIVLASAISIGNAERYTAQLKERGYRAEVRVMGKMVRVLIPGYKDATSAHEKIKEMRLISDEFNNAWMLKL